MVAPVRIGLEGLVSAEDRSAAILATQKETREARGEQFSNLPEREHLPGASRTLDQEIVAIVMVILLQGLNQQEVEREPDRTAPVGISTEEATARFGWLVTHNVVLAVCRIDIGVIGMILA